MLAGEQRADLGVLRFLLQARRFFLQIFEDVFSLAGKLEERFQIRQLARELGVQFHIPFELPTCLKCGLRFFLAGPELRVRGLLLQLRYFRLLMLCVKDNL